LAGPDVPPGERAGEVEAEAARAELSRDDRGAEEERGRQTEKHRADDRRQRALRAGQAGQRDDREGDEPEGQRHREELPALLHLTACDEQERAHECASSPAATAVKMSSSGRAQRSFRVSRVSSTTRRPSFKMATRSAIPSTAARSWVVTKTVVPRSA